MGERTQMLVSYISQQGEDTINTSSSISMSLHYQWGIGRVMLMDALNIAWGLLNEQWDYNDPDDQRFAAWLNRHTISGSLNLCDRDDNGKYFYSKLAQSWIQAPFRETMQDVFERSDNNDGYARLTVIRNTTTRNLDISLNLYDRDRQPVSLAEYTTSGGGEQYAPTAWQAAYRTMMNQLGITIIE